MASLRRPRQGGLRQRNMENEPAVGRGSRFAIALRNVCIAAAGIARPRGRLSAAALLGSRHSTDAHYADLPDRPNR